MLIPFALWSRLAAKKEREVGLPEVIREAFGPFVSQRELDDSFIEALADERLVLLIPGDPGFEVSLDAQPLGTVFCAHGGDGCR